MFRTIAVTAVAVFTAGLLTACSTEKDEDCRAAGDDELVLVAAERGGGGRGGSTGGGGHRSGSGSRPDSGHRPGGHVPAPHHDDCDDD